MAGQLLLKIGKYSRKVVSKCPERILSDENSD